MERTAPNIKGITLSDFSAFALGCVLIQLPFYQLYASLTIASWLFISIVASIVEKNKFKFSKKLVLPIAFYALYAIGIFWSANKPAAYFEMELKMSMILMPLIMMYLKYQMRQIKIIFYMFIFACVASGLYHVGGAGLRIAETGDFQQLFYVYLTPIIHPSYQSFYVNISIAILLFDLLENKLGLFNKKWIYSVLMGFLVMYSFILLSKNGILTSLVLVIVLLIYWWKNKRRLLVIAIVGLSVMSAVGAYKSSEYVRVRTNELISGFGKNATKKYLYSTSLRRVVWSEAWDLYKNEPWLGYGTGDVQDRLNIRYNAHVICQALDRTLNAHNQFLQTGLAVGITGILLLGAILLYPLRRFRRDHYFFGTFSLMSILFFSTESVLQTQAGVIAFMAFYCLLVILSELFSKNEATHTDTVLSA